MKKFIKITSLVLAICSVLICCTACGKAKSKTFSSEAGISITLTDKFYEKNIVSQTLYLESTDVIFTALKETFTILESVSSEPSELTKVEYAELVKQNNSLSAETIEDTANNLVYFTYTKLVSGKNFYYFAVVEKGSDAFWLCQFACEQKNESSFTSKFIKWAKTIVVV